MLGISIVARKNIPRIMTVAPDDRSWLAVMAVSTAAELIWWAFAFRAGLAPLPFLITYLLLSFSGLAAALALRAAVTRPRAPVDWSALLIGAALVGIGGSLFLPLKYAIPAEIPFWLDAPLATAERHVFGADPWLLLDRLFGGLLIPIDRVYGLWLPLQTLVLFSVMLQPASAAKSRALMAYSLAWFVLGVVAAMLFSSAGPLFYDRLLGGNQFALLHRTLHAGGAVMALGESDRMWTAFATGEPGMVAGVSALPSLHVAVSLWMYLVARTQAPREAWVALAYFTFIWLASVQLGWHYASDGLAAALGMLAIWYLAGILHRALQPVLGVGGSPTDRFDLR